MAIAKKHLSKVRDSALSIIELIDSHEDNDSEHESADTFHFIEEDVGMIRSELEKLTERIDWESTL